MLPPILAHNAGLLPLEGTCVAIYYEVYTIIQYQDVQFNS